MSLLVKYKEIDLDGEVIYCCVDNRTIAMFKDITGKSFLKSLEEVKDMEEDTILNMMACTFRTEPHGQPIGIKGLNKYNPLALIMNYSEPLMQLLVDSMPKAKPGADTGKK